MPDAAANHADWRDLYFDAAGKPLPMGTVVLDPAYAATMRRLAETLGPAPRAFLIITLAASLFTDTANAVAIQAFFDWLN